MQRVTRGGASVCEQCESRVAKGGVCNGDDGDCGGDHRVEKKGKKDELRKTGMEQQRQR